MSAPDRSCHFLFGYFGRKKRFSPQLTDLSITTYIAFGANGGRSFCVYVSTEVA